MEKILLINEFYVMSFSAIVFVLDKPMRTRNGME